MSVGGGGLSVSVGVFCLFGEASKCEKKSEKGLQEWKDLDGNVEEETAQMEREEGIKEKKNDELVEEK